MSRASKTDSFQAQQQETQQDAAQAKSAEKVTVSFPEQGKRLEVEAGANLLDVIRQADLSIESICNGRGSCGKCLVRVEGAEGALSEPDEAELKHLVGKGSKGGAGGRNDKGGSDSRQENSPGDLRLACRATVQGDVAVQVVNSQARVKSIFSMQQLDIRLDPPVKRVALDSIWQQNHRAYADSVPLEVAEPGLLSALADWKRSRKATSQEGESTMFAVQLQDKLLDLRTDTTPLLGAAVDIGTTSLSLYLFDLESGSQLSMSSGQNPQVAYGGDVLTRINYCRSEEDGLVTLQRVLLEELGNMLDEALEKHGKGYGREQVYLMTVAANTTMLHIFAGVSPYSLALSPFTPVFLHQLYLKGEHFSGGGTTESGSGLCRLPINPNGYCLLLPSASAYVGSDIIAGLRSVNALNCAEKLLFIDIGTNGELVLINGDKQLVATSCAMGPALEGMSISCGCRAIPGAIDTFSLDDDLNPVITTIDGCEPVGICGSGLIDIIAALLDSGLIGPSGAWDREADPRLCSRLEGDIYRITDQVSLSQKDIRQVQLAKGAISTGIAILLQEGGVTVADLDRVIVAGSFGYHLSASSLELIGFLPEGCKERMSYAGNSSLAGAALALLNREALSDMEALTARVRVLELGAHPDFTETYLESLNFD